MQVWCDNKSDIILNKKLIKFWEQCTYLVRCLAFIIAKWQFTYFLKAYELSRPDLKVF